MTRTPPPSGSGASSVSDKPDAEKLKPIQRIFANNLSKGYIEDDAAAERYLEDLRQQIKSALAAGKRVDIR